MGTTPDGFPVSDETIDGKPAGRVIETPDGAAMDASHKSTNENAIEWRGPSNYESGSGKLAK